MTELKPVRLENKAELDKFFRLENSRSADYCFGNVYIWDKRFEQYFAECGDRLITLMHRKGKEGFVFPVGSGDITPAFEFMFDYAHSHGNQLKLCGVLNEHLELVNSAYPDKFEVIEDRNYSDYLYDIEKLSAYPGKHLHSKRNFCNRFEAEYDWSFVPLTPEMFPDCEKMLREWTEQSFDRLESTIVHELDAIERGFRHYDELGFEGGALYADGRIVGFSIGERINEDTFCVHFEKAFTDIDGAYPMVCREMSKMIMQKHSRVRFINREDDMGSESLRKSKLSYKPLELVTKYILIEK